MRSGGVFSCSVAWALWAAALGCGATTGGEELEPMGSVSQQLRCWDGSNDPVCVWKANWSPLKGANDADIAGGHFKSPAVCVSFWEQGDQSRSGWLAVSADQNDKYEVLAFNGNVGPNRSASWGVYGSSKRWASKPTCASREATTWTDGSEVGGFVIAGKVLGNTGSDPNNNKIFASAGRFAPWNPGEPWQNPGFVTAFQEVEVTQPVVYQHLEPKLRRAVLAHRQSYWCSWALTRERSTHTRTPCPIPRAREPSPDPGRRGSRGPRCPARAAFAGRLTGRPASLVRR